jgi:hypothetical protein
MERRVILGYVVAVLTAFSGCVLDLSNDSRMSFSSTEIACSNKTVDINYDERNPSSATQETLNAIIESDQHTVTPPYPESAEKMMESLEGTGERAIIQYEGACYEITHNQIYDD